jgi:hypothetical protein
MLKLPLNEVGVIESSLNRRRPLNFYRAPILIWYNVEVKPRRRSTAQQRGSL